jgi:hypothetical protein
MNNEYCSRLRGARGAVHERVREGSGRVGDWSDPLHSLMWLPAVLRRQRRGLVQPYQGGKFIINMGALALVNHF